MTQSQLIKPVVLTPRTSRDDLISAIRSCEGKKKIPENLISPDDIQSLPFMLQSNGELKPQDVTRAAKAILDKLKSTEKALFVDAVSLAPALVLINTYKTKWGITDDIVDKLYNIVYDEENTERATVVRDITEALQLIEQYNETRQVVYITLPGHAFNFAQSIAEQSAILPGKLPEFEDIIEIDPEKAFHEIKSWLISGKSVVADRRILYKRPTIQVMLNTLAPSQRHMLHFTKEEGGNVG